MHVLLGGIRWRVPHGLAYFHYGMVRDQHKEEPEVARASSPWGEMEADDGWSGETNVYEVDRLCGNGLQRRFCIGISRNTH